MKTKSLTPRLLHKKQRKTTPAKKIRCYSFGFLAGDY